MADTQNSNQVQDDQTDANQQIPTGNVDTPQTQSSPAEQATEQETSPAQTTEQSKSPRSQHLTEKQHPDELSQTWRRTKCEVCHVVYEGTKVIKKCANCGNEDPDKFTETD